LKKCPGCCKVSYCNKKCQAKDWKKHKPACPPYAIRDIPGKGRGMFAIRKINPGQVILEEKPFFTMTVLGKHWLPDQFSGINKETKASILQLEDPKDNLMNLKKLDRPEFIGLDRMIEFYDKHYATEDAKQDGEARKILRIFINNNFTIDSDSALKGYPYEQGLYKDMCLINHSCNPNAVFTQNVRAKGDQRKQVRALKVIKKNEEISICYGFGESDSDGPVVIEGSLLFRSRLERQGELLKNRLFLCSCNECSLEGSELEENERIRMEIREIMQIREGIIKDYPYNTSKVVQVSQYLMELVRKLNDQQGIVTVVNEIALPVAEKARNTKGLKDTPDPKSLFQEQLEIGLRFEVDIMYQDV